MELNATEISGGTGIIEFDLVPLMLQTVIDLVPSMPQIVIAALFVIVGVVLGYLLSEQSRKNQEKNKVQKVKDLLKIDFERLNGLSITNIEKMLGFIEQTRDDNFIDDMMTSVPNVIKYLAIHIEFYNFAYWTVLSNSGHLIKLNKDEISIVYGAHFNITDATSEIEGLKKEYMDSLQDIVLDTTLANRKESFKTNLKLLTRSILIEYGSVYDAIQSMDISWLDKTQLSPENKKKLDFMHAEYYVLAHNELSP